MINLLPNEIKKTHFYGRRNTRLLGYVISLLSIGILTISVALINMQFVYQDENRLKKEMSEREVEITKLQASQKDVEKIASQLKTIDKLYSGEVKFSVLVPAIGSLLPNGVVLNALTLTGGKSSPLQLEIDMDQQNLAAVMQQNLVNSDLFEAVDISSITTKGAGENKPGQKTYSYGATLIASFKGSKSTKSSGGTK
ncbi:hypothetical protein EB118_04555 [bacterium]|nr:hypothetical protein [bacterium]NBX97665.1 hypothetical protein [bacterium]NDC94138.1 hypothetical protein [bacterium]NDD83135.1 hypothetical protein [bacterium]NDG29358.1 hypothetical protein [bacterium]